MRLHQAADAAAHPLQRGRRMEASPAHAQRPDVGLVTYIPHMGPEEQDRRGMTLDVRRPAAVHSPQ
jgi:hypothetical protein